MDLIRCITDSEEWCSLRLKIFSSLETAGIDAVALHIFIKIISKICLDSLKIIMKTRYKRIYL